MLHKISIKRDSYKGILFLVSETGSARIKDFELKI